MVAGTEMEHEDVISVLRKAHGSNQGLFNNAAQAFNHAFYWNCMKPNGGGKPTGKLAELIDKSFGSYDEFKTQFINAGTLIPPLQYLDWNVLLIIVCLLQRRCYGVWIRLGLARVHACWSQGHQDHWC